ncbi:SPOR domain-containing protein [Rubellimicrobium aerolatum]|uniref:SPOR domain-containing protein n=1 Tax=Rubellimicrobium aerolatum TaxID=490979 RepID=A0ABW0SB44_9RHOB|nr:SPOR domain-containing protein [Rubellimicrobium aerolatum]MBP1805455.1 hypothetical protein [Rubellimicrobium aerolatum]
MADWTANSSFGALGATRDQRAPRDAAPGAAPIKAPNPVPRAERSAPERFGPDRPAPSITGPAAASSPAPAYAALAEFNAREGGPLAKARLAAWAAGGALSVALVAGIGIWGYKLVLREVLGLPVVAAAEGPLRIVPADPGGEVVPSQGLAVNAIPAAGTAAPPSDVLMLAPPTPGLSKEDLEVAQTTAEAGERLPAEVAPVPTGQGSIIPSGRPLTQDEVLAFADQVSAATADAPAPTPAAAPATAAPSAIVIPPAPPTADAVPMDAPAPQATVTVAPEDAVGAAPAPDTVAVIPASVPGVATALLPRTRPATLAAALAAPAPAAEAAPAPEPVATSTVAAGTQMIQLGAYDSAEIAASEWQRLSGAFGALLGSRTQVIQEAQSGGRTFFRLRATGFADRADARRLCAALTADGADCIPVTAD